MGAGGAEKQFNLLSNELLKYNFKTNFVLTQKKDLFYDTLGTESIVLENNITNTVVSHVVMLVDLLKFIKKNKINILFSCYESKLTTLYSRLVKLVFKDIIIISGYRNSIMHKDFVFLDKITNFLCDKMIANNPDVCKQMGKSIPNAKSKMICIPNIADEKSFYRIQEKKVNKLRQSFFPDTDKNISIIGCFASYKSQKNQLLMVESMQLLKAQSRMPNIQIHCFGDKSCDNSQFRIIKEKIDEYGLKNWIKLHNAVSEINLYINSVDGIILTSHFEGFPNIIMEAILCEKHCIISDIANNMGLIDNKNGIIFKQNDAEDLAKKLLNFPKMLLNQNNPKKEFLLKKNNIKSITSQYIATFNTLTTNRLSQN